MSEFVRICSKGELPAAGQVAEMFIGTTPYCIANVDGAFSVLGGICPHREGPLGRGNIEEGHVICPWHAWAFDLKSGISAHSPNAKVDVYPVKMIEEDVLIDIQG